MTGKLKGNESVLPPITVLAEQIRDGRTVEAICDEYGVSRSTLQGRFSTAGYAMSTGEKQAKRGGDRQPLKSVRLGTGGVYIGGRDWDRGLPTPDAPARHQPRPKHTGLPWEQIDADYTARGGQVDADVWPNAGKVIVIGGEGLSRHRVHSWVEAEPETFEYDQPLANPTTTKSAKPGATTAKLSPERAKRACARYRDGLTIQEVADEFLVSFTAIRTALKNHSEPIRDRVTSKQIRAGRRS
jgi:uncharacterized protein (DUF433 family)